MALGATGTLIGKAFLNGLGAMGRDGVQKCLALIANELDLTMAFCGHTELENVTSEVIWRQSAR
jgi:L-lactate dehydrogenase (cytochrome)